MSFNLNVAVPNGSLVASHQRRPHSGILLPVPEAKVVVEDVLARPRALRFRGIAKHVVVCPYPLRAFAVGLTHAVCEVKGVHFVFDLLMAWFMQLGDQRPSLNLRWYFDALWPRLHSFREVREPLASYVVAQDDE